MPIDLLQYLEEQDVLAVGRLKLNYNFETLVDFVNYLEAENHAERNSTIDIVQGLHGFSIGDAIRFDSVSGLFVKSRADTPENSEVFGIVSGYEDVSRFTVTLTGLLHDLGFNLTVGAVYYLQDDGSVGTSPGTISRTLYGVIPPAEDGEPNRGVVLNESSISSIEALRDVDLTGLADNDVLVYSADDQTWVAKALDFDSLIGIDGTPNNGDILIYNASDGLWKPEPPVGGGDMYTAIYDPQRIGVVETARHALEVDWTNVSNKDLTQHTHPILQVVGLSGELANKAQRVHRHDNASQTEDGFLSKEDKVKLDDLDANTARTDGENTLTGVQTIQGQLRVSNGSAAAPSVVFDSDRDTGIYRVTGNEFAVATGGARRMSINATRAYFDGNVEITGNVEINGTYTRSATPSTGNDLDLINRGWFNNNYLQEGDVTGSSLAIRDTSNIVKNPDFFEGSSDGWYGDPFTIVAATGNDRHSTHALQTPGTPGTRYGTRKFTVENQGVYLVSCWVKRQGSANGSLRVGLETSQVTGAHPDDSIPAIIVANSVPNGEWRNYTGWVQIPNPMNEARLFVSNDNTTGSWQVANIILRQAAHGDMLPPGAVTNDKVASGISASKLTTGTLPIARIATGAHNSNNVAPGQGATGSGNNRHPVGSVRFVVSILYAPVAYGSTFSDAAIARIVPGFTGGLLMFEAGDSLPGTWQALSEAGTPGPGYNSSLPVLAVRVS